jgi:hypothetical protein
MVHCEVCGKPRPDNKISVYQHDIGIALGLPASILLVRTSHCMDSGDCIFKAVDMENAKVQACIDKHKEDAGEIS